MAAFAASIRKDAFMIELNVVNVVTIGLIALLFIAFVRWLLGLIQSKRAAAAG